MLDNMFKVMLGNVYYVCDMWKKVLMLTMFVAYAFRMLKFVGKFKRNEFAATERKKMKNIIFSQDT